MTAPDHQPGLLQKAATRALALPLLIKVLGAVTVVALLFGAVVNLYVRHSLTATLSRLTEQTTLARATAFAARAESLLITGDRMGLQDLVRRERQSQDSLRYILVCDSQRRIVAHSFRGPPPKTLVATLPRDPITRTKLQTLRTHDEIIFQAVVPIVNGQAGFVQFGVGSRPIVQRVDRMVNRLWLVLALCLIAGLLIIIPLAHAMTAPLQRLIHATDMLRRGELSFRAPEAPLDEVGELTAAFNRMADDQQRQRQKLDAIEAERLELLDAIVRSQEDERRRIAHDLHDELGGSLSALLIELRVSHEKCTALDDQPAAWDSIEAQVRGMINKVRQLAWTLRPAALDDIGLCAALEEHAAYLQRHTGMTIEFCGHSAVGCACCRCPSDIKLTLYRVAQEAMTNSLRHSGASRVSLIVASGKRSVSVLVEDDGCGFEPTTLSADRPHLGLRGMQERVGSVGGTLTVESAPASGTVVRATIPIVELTCLDLNPPPRPSVSDPPQTNVQITEEENDQTQDAARR